MNDWERLHRQAEEYKESYPPGTRVMLLHMNDPYHPIDDGMRGTVDHVDDGANIHMRWDNGRTLALCPEDSFRRLTQEEIDQELRDQAQEQSIVDLANKYGFDTYVQKRLHNMAQSTKPGEMFEELLIGNFNLLDQAELNNKYLLEQTRQLTLFDFQYDY